MIFAPTLSNPFQLPYINPNFGTSGTSGTGGTGGGSAVNYTLIRFEGASSTSGTVGASTSIYEIYLFVNGFVELRLGSWANTGGVSGHYSSGGTGTAFTLQQQTSYVWNASGFTTSLNSGYTYLNGAVYLGTLAPSLGNGSASVWVPGGWQGLQNGNVDDSFVNVPITSTTFFGTARNTAYVGSNAYITFGNGSSNYSGLSTTNPPFDKFMFNSGDRSYQRVAYTTGSK
jgi:hypothetical protein